LTETLKEKKREKGTWYIREWRLVPGEWREAKPEEIKEIETTIDDVFLDFRDFLKRLRRFHEKLEEAFRELFC